MGKIFLKDITLDGRQVDIVVDGRVIAAIRPAGGWPVKPAMTEGAPAMTEGAPAMTEGASDVTIDCAGKTAMPGFVNAHTHAAMSLMRGVGEDMVLKDWLDHVWSIEKNLDNDFVYWGTRVAALEMAMTGTTVFNDMYWYPSAAKKATSDSGLRGVISYVFLDGFNKETAERQKDECEAFIEEAKSWEDRVIPAISIHSIYTVREEAIIRAAELARRNGLRIHIHLAETEAEVTDCKAAHGGLTPTEYFDSLGVLGPDVIAAHSLWLSEKDVEILGRRGVNCVHNINSNLKLASGYRFLWKELRDAGANVCLGTDGCASSNNLDMLEAMKTAAIVEKAWRNDPTALPIQELLDMATVNGGKALGLKTGQIQEGWDADIQIVDTDSTFFLSPAPFLANYVYSAHSDCISSLIAGGRLVMRDRVVEGSKDVLEGGRSQLKQINKTK